MNLNRTPFNRFHQDRLEYDEEVHSVFINFEQVKEGVSQDENFIFYRRNENVRVYDRICDHNGGRLSVSQCLARCPLHGWEFNPENGLYTNVSHSKSDLYHLNLNEFDSQLIELNYKKSILRSHQYSQEAREPLI